MRTARRRAKTASKAMPTSRNGTEISQTMGQRIIARSATGQQRTRRIKNRRFLNKIRWLR
jgi:hypothetical protein